MRRLLPIPILVLVGYVLISTAPAQARQAQPAPPTGRYEVVSGDNFWDVAEGCGTTVAAALPYQQDPLVRENPARIWRGMVLILPLPTALPVEEPTPLGELARRCGVPFVGVAAANRLPADPNLIVPAGRTLNMVPPPPPPPPQQQPSPEQQPGALTPPEPKLPTDSTWFPVGVAGFAALLAAVFLHGRRARRRTAVERRPYERWVLRVLLAASFMVGIVYLALQVTLPAVSGDFPATQKDLLQIANGYTLVHGSLIFLAVGLVMAWGERLVLWLGSAVFLGGALTGAGAASISDWIGRPETEVLRCASWLLGAGAAAIVISSFSQLLDEFEGEEERAGATVKLIVATLMGVVVGPLMVGYLIRYWGWESVYWALAAAGLFILVAATTLRPNRPEKPEKVDWRGAVESVLALGLTYYGLVTVDQPGQLTTAILFMLSGLALVVDFVWWERQVPLLGRRPVLDLSLFQQPLFAATCAIAALVWLLLLGNAWEIGLYLQVAMLLDAVDTGWLVIALVTVLPSAFLARFVKRRGGRAVAFGLVALGAGFYVGSWLDLGPGSQADRFGGLLELVGQHGPDLEGHIPVDRPLIWSAFAIAGIGAGVALTRLTSMALTPLPKDKRTAGTAGFRFAQLLPGSVGSVVLGILVASRYRIDDALLSQPLPPAQRKVAEAGLVDAALLARSQGRLDVFHAARESFASAMRFELRVSFGVALAAAALAVALLDPPGIRRRFALASFLSLAAAHVILNRGVEVKTVLVPAVLWLVLLGLDAAFGSGRRDRREAAGRISPSGTP